MDNIQEILSTYGYIAIVVLTFLEGETVVILAGIAAYQGFMDVNLVLLSALSGTFAGDQLYFAIGRKYGTPLLEKWPQFERKIDWAFRMLRKWETPFILSFRFIYGIRNVTPFVIGMSGIPRLKYFLLNLTAATVWAGSFAYGGYYFGETLERYVGGHQTKVLAGLAVIVFCVGILVYLRNNLKLRKARLAKQKLIEEAEGEVCLLPDWDRD